MAITLIVRTRHSVGDSGFAWWNHYLDRATKLRDRLIGGLAIVGAIGSNLFYFLFNLGQQWPHLRRIIRLLISEHLGDKVDPRFETAV